MRREPSCPRRAVAARIQVFRVFASAPSSAGYFSNLQLLLISSLSLVTHPSSPSTLYHHFIGIEQELRLGFPKGEETFCACLMLNGNSSSFAIGICWCLSVAWIHSKSVFSTCVLPRAEMSLHFQFVEPLFIGMMWKALPPSDLVFFCQSFLCSPFPFLKVTRRYY